MLRQRRCHWQNLSWSWVWCWKSVIKTPASWPLPVIGLRFTPHSGVTFVSRRVLAAFWKALILLTDPPANTQSGDYRSWYFFSVCFLQDFISSTPTACQTHMHPAPPAAAECRCSQLISTFGLMSPTETPLLTFMWNSVRHQSCDLQMSSCVARAQISTFSICVL